MSEHLQSGLHPDADQLNAFVEHAMPPHEREQTLAHLAICPVCRSIVSLSMPPAEEPALPQPEPARRRPWFLGWNLAWPIAAAFAALVPVILYVHKTETSQGKLPPPAQIAASEPPAPPLTPPAPVPPPAAKVPSPRAAAEKPANTPAVPPAATDRRSPVPPPVAAAAPEPVRAQSQPAAAPQSPPVRGALAGVMGGLGSGAPQSKAAAGNGGIYAGTGQNNLNENYVEGLPAQALAPPPAPPPPPTTTITGAALQPLAAAKTAAIANSSGTRLGAMRLKAAAPPAPLPSGLPTLSTAFSGRLVLALDTANTLFFSNDEGRRWNPVPAQWKGHVVRVELAAAPAAKSQAEARAATPAASARDAVRPGESNATADAVVTLRTQRLPSSGIQGTITDPSGAAIPGAVITATNTDTGVRETRTSNTAGVYSMPLPAGPYIVEVIAKGFQRLLQEKVAVDKAAMLGLNLKLSIGGAAETVTVTDAPTLLDTTDATLGGAIENELYSELPLSSSSAQRNPATFKELMPSRQPAPLFEITTESGERWTSPDGQTWTRRPN